MWERFSALAELCAHSEFLVYYPTCDEFYTHLFTCRLEIIFFSVVTPPEALTSMKLF